MSTEEPLLTDHDVELSNERIVLRAFRLEDADEVYEAVCESKSQLARWLPWCHADYGKNDTLEFLNHRGEAFRRDGEHAFAIVERTTGRFVGATGINQIDRANRRANLGYWLRTSATGLGYATQGALLVARWAFSQLGLERIEIVAVTDNVTSQRVAVRAGAKHEGLARRRLRVGDEQCDAVVFSLVPSDLPDDNGVR